MTTSNEYREALSLICIAAEDHVRNDCMTTALALAGRIKEAKALLARPESESWYSGKVDTDVVREILNLNIEPSAAEKARECTITPVLKICVAYESGFGHGLEFDSLPNPYSADSQEHEAYSIGYEEAGKRRNYPPAATGEKP